MLSPETETETPTPPIDKPVVATPVDFSKAAITKRQIQDEILLLLEQAIQDEINQATDQMENQLQEVAKRLQNITSNIIGRKPLAERILEDYPTPIALSYRRFKESIDQILAESVSHYTKKVNYSKDLFIGVLSHDLRNPLGAISMSAQLMMRVGQLNDRSTRLAKQISESAARTLEIVNDLLDVTRARFGNGLPVMRAPMNMGFVSRQLIDEMRLAFPNRKITLDVSGELRGEWDKARIG